jgi:hypothetical protein
MAVEPKNITSEEYNDRIAGWSSATGVKIRASIKSLTSKGKGDLLRWLRAKNYKYYGEIDRIGYSFPRHGVFLHKGVGRGYAMVGGKVVRVSGSLQNSFWKEYAKLKNRNFSPKVLRDTEIMRKAVEWFNPVIRDNIDKLADMVAEMRADQSVNATKILIR